MRSIPGLFRVCIFTIATAAAGGLAAAGTGARDYPVRPVPFTDVAFTGGLWRQRQETNRQVTLPFGIKQLETSNRLKNFDLAAETMKRRAAGDKQFQNKPPTQYPFDDSDVYKVLEGAAYSLSLRPDPALAARLEAIIARVATAQEPDGYLYTWRTMHPDSPVHPWLGANRWEKDPVLSHETYNLGHLYEAGTAYRQATGSDLLNRISLKTAELLQRDFGDGKNVMAPGHEVVEMGLAKLYRATGDRRWLDLADLFLQARGRGGSDYSQDHIPVVAQREAVGHAVRANYLYSGMADVAALKGRPDYMRALEAIWDNVVGCKLHLTGGCGARASGEAYGNNYELPNRCYNETCAAIAFLFWNHRMFLASGDGKYMDVFERTLYNGFLSGVSISGDRFFYPNTLEYDGQEKNNHGFAGRAPWFGCACCPPNVMRLMASLGGYVYAVSDKGVYVNLYAGCKSSIPVAGTDVDIAQTTSYPWDGRVRLALAPPKPVGFALRLRIPCWSLGHPLPTDLYSYANASPTAWSIKVNGQAVKPALESGYAVIDREWKAGDTVDLDLPMPVRRVRGNLRIDATKGRVALERGPMVYCFEGVDCGGNVADLVLPEAAKVSPLFRKDLLGGVMVLDVRGALRVAGGGGGYPATTPARLMAIPYAWWDNRGLSPMAVWLAAFPDVARVAPPPSLSSQAKVGVSFVRGGMDTGRLNDLRMPRNATDGFAAAFDFWPHKGGSEWICYEFNKPVKIGTATVSWFDDTGSGECRLPKAWRLSYRDQAGTWRPVGGRPDYAIRKGEPVTVRYEPVTTRALRLEVDLPQGYSSGLYEFEAGMAD